MADLREHVFPDAESLALGLAKFLAAELSLAATQRGTAIMAVSGGRSPILLFETLAREAIDWTHVILTQVDERWVAIDDSSSNSRLIRDHLLQGPASAADFRGLRTDVPSAAAAQPAVEAMLRALPDPFDVTLLGMGEDGHTASLFPHAPKLAEALRTPDLCAATTAPVAPRERISLTLSGLLRTRLLIMPISGAAKRAVYERALGDGPVEDMPVRAILRQRQVPVEVWLSED